MIFLTPGPFLYTISAMLKRYATLIYVLSASALLVCLGVAANLRNEIYKTPVTLWADNAAKSPDKRRTHENYGQALSTAGMYQAAIKQFETVKALNDDGSVPLRDLYREIGVVYFRLGLIDDSIDSWQTGLKYAPFDPSLSNNLAVALLRKGRLDEAESTVRTALTVQPTMPHLWNTLGEVMMAKGKDEEAANAFLTSIEYGPDVPARFWNAALALSRTGQYEKAYEYGSRYLAMEPDYRQRQQAAEFLGRLQAGPLSKGKPRQR
jgi:tetratricopeptide (TPR) repeat protein